MGALAEVKCETDFVSGTDKFKTLAAKVAQAAAEVNPADIDGLKAAEVEGETVEAIIQNGIATMGENMTLTRFVRRSTEAGAISSYIHMGGKIGVLVEFSFDKPETATAEAFKAFAHDVAMQVAATAPIAAVREDVAQDVIDHEVEIYKAQAAESGKPEAIQEKMAIGRLEKFFKGIVLNEQEFIKDSSLTIKAYAEKVSKELGDTVKVVAFDRLVCGE